MPNFETPSNPQVEKDSGLDDFDRKVAKVKELVSEVDNLEELEAKLQEEGIEYFDIQWNKPGDEDYDEEIWSDANHPVMQLMDFRFHIAKDGAQVAVLLDKHSQF